MIRNRSHRTSRSTAARLCLGSACVALLLGGVAREALSQDDGKADTLNYRPPVRVNVSATEAMHVVPDRAVAYFVVDAAAPTLALASSRARDTGKSVAESLKKIGSGLTVTLTNYGAGQSTDLNGSGTPPPSDPFIGRSVLRAEVGSLPLLADAVDTAFAKGATSLAALQFETSRADSLREAGVAKVIARLRREGAVAAEQLGGRLGTLETLQLNPGFSANQPLRLDVSTRYQAGQPWRTAPDVVISVSAYASFALAADGATGD